jgi:hypothetical protein
MINFAWRSGNNVCCSIVIQVQLWSDGKAVAASMSLALDDDAEIVFL